MKLLGSLLRCRLKVSTSLHYSTQTRTTPPQHDPLVRRIMPLGNPRVSIAPVLDQWVEEGQAIENTQLKELIRCLRNQRRFTHALQASEWMSDKRNHNLSPEDFAVQLDLIAKVHGVEEVEQYFDSIPANLRGPQVHGALLNCYVEKNAVDKAEIEMQKNRKLGFLNALHYNSMLRLYFRVKKYEKIEPLVQEMKESGINPDMYTYNIQLNACAASSDLESMEKILMKMEIDPLITMEWHSYIIAAKGYLKAKLTDKASAMLKKAEHCINFQARKLVYETILGLHAAAGNKDEVYRIWKLYKTSGKFYNKGYLIMIRSLLTLNDIDGAEMIFAEWASRCNTDDVRIPNCMVTAYCKRSLSAKAEALVNSLKEPQAVTWGILATGYRFEGQMEKAVEIFKKAMLAIGGQQYVPNIFTLEACHEYLKGKGDVEAQEELLRLLRQRYQVNCADYNELVHHILDSKKPSSPEGDEEDQACQLPLGVDTGKSCNSISADCLVT